MDPAYFDATLGDVVSTRNPKFQWNPPDQLPDTGDLAQGGIQTYLVALTGDPSRAPGFSIPFVAYTDSRFFEVECFRGAADTVPDATGDACTTFIGSGDVIRITVIVAVPDGTHLLGVRVRPTAGKLGPFQPLTFSVDATAPPAPTLKQPSDRSNVFEKTPTFVWSRVTDPPFTGNLKYILEIARGERPATGASGQFINPAFTGDISQPTSGDVRFPLPLSLGTGDFAWQVRAIDLAGNTSDLQVHEARQGGGPAAGEEQGPGGAG